MTATYPYRKLPVYAPHLFPLLGHVLPGDMRDDTIARGPVPGNRVAFREALAAAGLEDLSHGEYVEVNEALRVELLEPLWRRAYQYHLDWLAAQGTPERCRAELARRERAKTGLRVISVAEAAGLTGKRWRGLGEGRFQAGAARKRNRVKRRAGRP